MKSHKRITHAYCIQAGEVMSITDARQFYFSNPTHAKLSFFCSTRKCRDLGVKVTGANYHIPPQELSKHVAPYYRGNSTYDHDQSCEWVGREEAVGAQRSGESNAQYEERKARAKLKDYIDIFNPDSDADEQEGEAEGQGGGCVRSGGPIASNASRGPGKLRHATNSMERLVQCYRDAKSKLSKEEFEALTLHVKGLGEISLYSYFLPIKWARPGKSKKVLFGGARYKKYGAGFRFDFYDEINDKPVSLYVGHENINAYRFRRYWFSLFKQAENVKYFTVYALGELKDRVGGKGVDFVVEDLRRLAIVLGPEKDS